MNASISKWSKRHINVLWRKTLTQEFTIEAQSRQSVNRALITIEPKGSAADRKIVGQEQFSTHLKLPRIYV